MFIEPQLSNTVVIPYYLHVSAFECLGLTSDGDSVRSFGLQIGEARGSGGGIDHSRVSNLVADLQFVHWIKIRS